MTQRLFFLTFAAIMAFAGCAEVQRIPEPPRYTGPQAERRAEPKPIAEQNVHIMVRSVVGQPVTQASAVAASSPAAVTVATMPVTATSGVTAAALPAAAPINILEAKLSGVPTCTNVLVERMDGVQPVRQVLGQEDEILMWSAYGGAGLVALLTTIGMARGQDPARGVLLFGIYGVPLAGVGAFETWRMRTVEEPIAPRYSLPRTLGDSPCPKGSDGLPARVVLGAGAATDVTLSPAWSVVPGGEPLAARYEAETEAATALRDGRLTAFLGVPPPRVAAPVTAPAATSALTNAALPVSAPAMAAPVSTPAAPRPCAELAVRTKTSDWLPKAFFDQPVREAALLDGVSLEAFAEAELGGKQFLWQVEELNPGLAQALQGARPIKVKVPVQVKSASDWKSLLPPTCE